MIGTLGRRGATIAALVVVGALVLVLLSRFIPSMPSGVAGASSSIEPVSSPAIPAPSDGPSFSPTPTEASPTNAPTPVPSASPTDIPSTNAPTLTPTPISASVDVEAHDQFWDPFVDFGPPIGLPYGLKTVADANELAHVVVVGQISDLYIGEQWIGSPDADPQPLAYVTVTVSEVLKGEPVSMTDGAVEVQFGFGFNEDDFERVASGPMPSGDYIWFLIHEATHREEGGRPPRDSEIAPFAYFIPNEVQGVVLDADGLIEVPLHDRFEGSWGTEKFPMSIRGQDVADVLEQIRQLSQ